MITHDISGLRAKYATIPDERFFAEIFDKGEYGAMLSKPAHIVIDVGALAGEFSVYIYDKATTIHAIEPNPAYYKELTENIQEFGLTKIKPYNFAIGEYNGIGKLSVDSTRGAPAITLEERESIEVPMKTLAQFIKDEQIARVDILKIDIEGYEEKVFTASDFVTVVPFIDCIIGEHLQPSSPYLEKLGFTKRVDGHNYIFEK